VAPEILLKVMAELRLLVAVGVLLQVLFPEDLLGQVLVPFARELPGELFKPAIEILEPLIGSFRISLRVDHHREFMVGELGKLAKAFAARLEPMQIVLQGYPMDAGLAMELPDGCLQTPPEGWYTF